MHQGPVLRNSLIVALRRVVISVVARRPALCLPLCNEHAGPRAPGQPGKHRLPTAGQLGRQERCSFGRGAGSPIRRQHKETADSREISVLIRQLGDPAYTVRQRATKRLVELGIITQPLLIASARRRRRRGSLARRTSASSGRRGRLSPSAGGV